MPVPLFDTETPLAPLRSRLREVAMAVLDRGTYILGPELAAFETELAERLGARHVVGVANGTDAITIALRALGIGPGDDVIVPSFTFYASAEAIVNAGARPVFCDVDPETRNVTVETVRAALTPSSKAIVAVDLFGLPADIPSLEELGLPVVEDAAQAIGGALGGVAAGTLGDIGTFSFYPSKNLGAFGDGGAIVTDDAQLAERCRAFRFHGSRDKRTFEYVGQNSRLDELQAALLRVVLPSLDEFSQARRDAATAYADAGLGEFVALPVVPEGVLPAWHLYVVTHPRADELVQGLNESGVGARGYYRVPVHRQPGMMPYAGGMLELPDTDALAATNLALPIGAALGADAVAEVVAAVAELAPALAGAR